MNSTLVATLVVLGPLAFGAAMATLAYWVFDLSSARLSPRDFAQTMRWVLSWMVGNGAVIIGGTFLANLTAALEGLPWGVAVLLLSYLLGFGTGILFCALAPSRDHSLIARLRTILSGRQVETILLLYKYGETDIDAAANKMGIGRDDFIELHDEALRAINRRWKSMKDLLAE